MEPKLSEQLLEHLKNSDPSQMLEVIIELRARDKGVAAKLHSRSEKIAELKETFSRNVAHVEDTVRRVGGELTGHAWINSTVRARVPVDSVIELSQHEDVARLDLPHGLEPEVPK